MSDTPRLPDTTVDVREAFDLDVALRVPAFSAPEEHVPEREEGYRFDRDTTLAILAGFAHDRRVLVQGLHGSGKSSHIEQVAARLNWPCIRVNLDSHVSRMDLVGKEGIVARDGLQVTEFQPGILTWALQHPAALVFDEYDAGRPDVMFVIQRVLEAQGRLTLLDQGRVITPHPAFRLFATANTVGLGDATGLYHGTQPLNQAQLDRWHVVANLDNLSAEQEEAILLARCPGYDDEAGRARLRAMVRLGELSREGFRQGELSTLISLRTLLTWAENTLLFGDLGYAFRVSFLNRCDEEERSLLAEYYQRCTGEELGEGGGGSLTHSPADGAPTDPAAG